MADPAKSPSFTWAVMALAVLASAMLAIFPWWFSARAPTTESLTNSANNEAIQQALGEDNHGSSEVGVIDEEDDQRLFIRGQVLQPNGEPAPDATVIVQASRASQRYEATTDAAGMFQVSGIQALVHIVEATHPEFGPAMAVGVRPGETPLRMVLQSGRELSGTVLYNEEPVAGAVVRLAGPGLYPPRLVVADASGQYRLPGARAGTWQLVVTAPGAGTGFGHFVEIPDDGRHERIRHDIILQDAPSFTLTVAEQAGGQPLAGVVATISEAPIHLVSLGVELSTGVVDVDFLPPGAYWVRILAPGYLPHAQRLLVTGDPVRVTLSAGARITGRVVDEAGNGLADVQLTAFVSEGEGPRWELRNSLFDELNRMRAADGSDLWYPDAGYVSDEDGHFALTGLPEGTVVVRATHPSWATTSTPTLRLRAQQDLQGIEVVMTQGRSIRGRVEDAGGSGLADAVITVRNADLPDWAEGLRLRTDSTGVFRFDRLAAEVIVRVQHDTHGSMEFALSVPAEGQDNLIIRYGVPDERTWSGRIFHPRGDPAAGATVWLIANDRDVPLCRATVDDEGWFHMTDCAGSPETMVAVGSEGAPLIADLGPSRSPRDWTLPRGGELDVVSQQNPVQVLVSPLFSLPEVLWPRQRFDMERWSRNRLSRLAPGRWHVSCQTVGFGPSSVEVLVVDDQRVEAVCPHQTRLIAMPVFVVDPMGAPVANAVVFVDGVDPPIRNVTDSSGRIVVETVPDTALHIEAMHEDWGTGSARLAAPSELPSQPLRVRLDQPIGGDERDAFLDELADWGINAVVDYRSIVVDTVNPESPARVTGLRRGDRVLWFRQLSQRRHSLGIRRDNELLPLELIRATDQ